MPRAEQIVLPITGLVLISAGSPISNTPLPAETRGLLIGNAGVLNVTIQGTAHLLVPFVAGVTPGFFESVQAGGSASNIWAVL